MAKGTTKRFSGSNGPASIRDGVTPGGRRYKASTWKTKDGDKIFHVEIPTDKQPVRGYTHYSKVSSRKGSSKTVTSQGKYYMAIPRDIEKGPTKKKVK